MGGRKLTLDDIPVFNKRVIIRVNFNVKIKDGKITDPRKILRHVPTIERAFDRGALAIVLISHRGKPRGRRDEELTLEPIAHFLAEHIKRDILYVAECAGAEAAKACAWPDEGTIYLLENLRFHPEEEGVGIDSRGQIFHPSPASRKTFVTSLTHNGDIFVNDWLAANKDHDCASLALSHWYRVAGVDLDKQVQALELIINEAKRPLTLIVGGLDIGKWLATADALIKLIQNVAVDDVLIGGLVGVLFLKYLQKMNTGATKLNVEAGEQESEANRRVFQFVQKCESRGTQVHLPKDFEVLDRVKDPLGKQMGVVDVARGVPSNQEVVDIGMDTTNMFNEFIKNSATVVWFSSVGDTRNNFTHSTSAMLDTLVEATRGGAFSAVVGGALSRYTEQVKRLRAPEHLSYISSDTSAWIEYLAGDGLYCWSLLSSEDDLRRPRYTVERDPTGAGVTHEPFTLRGANDLLDGRTMNGHVALSEPQQYDLDREREKRRDELANLFDECDLDGSGAIVLEELRIVLNGKGYTDHFVERFFCHLDLNKDGQIERDEFREALKFLPKKIFLSNEPISDRDMFGVFDDLDTDNSGTLTWHELREGLLLRGVPYSVIKSYFDQLDLNEDSEITKREYAKCIGLQGY